ncbi:MAG: heme-binding protein, partial [Bacteroidota bacterium]
NPIFFKHLHIFIVINHMKVTYLIKTLTLIFIVFQSLSSFSASSIETQKYRVVKKEEGFEIRYYPKATFATIRSTGTNYKMERITIFNVYV